MQNNIIIINGPNINLLGDRDKSLYGGETYENLQNRCKSEAKKIKVNIDFYHSNIGKEIVGIVKVINEAFIDKTDKKKRFVAVQVRFQEYIKYPISLEKIKKTKTISHLPLIKQSRLSVMPIDFKSWKIIYKMGKIKSN